MRFLALTTICVLAIDDSSASPIFEKTSIVAPFLEQFTPSWKSVWIPSQAKKEVDGVVEEDMLLYRGEWAVEVSEGDLVKGDLGLVLKSLAAHSAISAKFEKPLEPKDKTLVVQYEVKTQNGLECGGAYMKLLSYNKDFKPATFGDKTPYTIMFGPDKCGSNNRVHFIFRHQNPVTKEFEEKHLESPPSIISDKKTNLYTLIINADQTFEIKINNESKTTGSLLKSFSPPVNPPAKIDDPNDSKPNTWVDEAKIVDPSATKPKDWNEDAPLEIRDVAATMPSDWLESESETIADPNSIQPEDWDDEEDGVWTATSIDNPKCEKVSGCGKWSAPMMRNPAYKGKWIAPKIDNPDYKGEWAPKKISNPSFFEDLKPANFNQIGAIGFELWSMQDSILFDNIYIGHSVADAQKLAGETWLIKSKLEALAEPVVEADIKKSGDYIQIIKDYAAELKDQGLEFVEILQVDPVEALTSLPHIAALFGLSVLLPIYLISLLLSGKKKNLSAKKTEAKKVDTKKLDGNSADAKKVDSKKSEDKELEVKKVVKNEVKSNSKVSEKIKEVSEGAIKQK